MRPLFSVWISSFFLPGGIASVVGFLDEFYQRFIPNRNASLGDVMLDAVGIILPGTFITLYQQRRNKWMGTCPTRSI